MARSRGTEEIHENLCQKRPSPDRDLNQGPCNYDAGIIPTLPQYSVNILQLQQYILEL
jgi:hypothetical protein